METHIQLISRSLNFFTFFSFFFHFVHCAHLLKIHTFLITVLYPSHLLPNPVHRSPRDASDWHKYWLRRQFHISCAFNVHGHRPHHADCDGFKVYPLFASFDIFSIKIEENCNSEHFTDYCVFSKRFCRLCSGLETWSRTGARCKIDGRRETREMSRNDRLPIDRRSKATWRARLLRCRWSQFENIF